MYDGWNDELPNFRDDDLAGLRASSEWFGQESNSQHGKVLASAFAPRCGFSSIVAGLVSGFQEKTITAVQVRDTATMKPSLCFGME
jgi:hypothetical protein